MERSLWPEKKGDKLIQGVQFPISLERGPETWREGLLGGGHLGTLDGGGFVGGVHSHFQAEGLEVAVIQGPLGRRGYHQGGRGVSRFI